jgi:hypothetical protein
MLCGRIVQILSRSPSELARQGIVILPQMLVSSRLCFRLFRLPPVVDPLLASRAADGLKVVDDRGHTLTLPG